MRKLKIFICLTSYFFLGKIAAVEQDKTELSIPTNPTLIFLKAWKLAEDNSINAKELELSAKIKRVLACNYCTPTEKKFFLTLLNNPEINLFKADVLVNDLAPLEYRKQLCDTASDGYKCEVSLTSNILQTMLQDAMKKNRVELAELLIDAGVDIQGDPASSSPLIQVINLGNKEMAHLFIDRGANIKFKSFAGNTALKAAERKDYKDIIESLKKHRIKQ